MIHYTLPRETFQLLEETFRSREKAEVFATTMEEFLSQIDEKTHVMVADRLDHIRARLKQDLTETLVTKEYMEQRLCHLEEKWEQKMYHIDEKFKRIDDRFKHLDFKLNIIIGVAVIGLTLANSSFLSFVKYIFK